MPANWNLNRVPATTDRVAITNDGTYTVTMDTSATVAGLLLGGTTGTQTLANNGYTLTLSGASLVDRNGILALNSGTLAGSGSMFVHGAVNWAAGTVNATITTTCNGTLNISGSAEKTFSGNLTNAGTIVWSGGTWDFTVQDREARLVNFGLVEIRTDDYMQRMFNSHPSELLNWGEVRKTRGAGSCMLGVATKNYGLIAIESGTLALRAPLENVDAGRFEGQRLFLVGGGWYGGAAISYEAGTNGHERSAAPAGGWLAPWAGL